MARTIDLDVRPDPPAPEHHHRDVKGGAARAAVFGLSDGLVSNVGLILGVAGATTTAGDVRIAGFAGLVAGAVSMAAGEYNSMRVQSELMERELDLERREISRNPQYETAELAQLYESRGVDSAQSRVLAEAVMADPEVALQTHAREELGIDPDELGSPVGAATSSFVAFAVGATVPLLPWFLATGGAAIVASLALAMATAVVLGVVVARATDRPVRKAVLRQVALTAIPAAITFAIGSVVGTAV